MIFLNPIKKKYWLVQNWLSYTVALSEGIESLTQTLSLQPNVVDLRYFKLWILIDIIYLKLKVSLGCKDISIMKFVFVAKTEFLYICQLN